MTDAMTFQYACDQSQHISAIFNVSNEAPFGTAVGCLDIEAQKFDDAVLQLQAAASCLRDLSSALNTAGDDLFTLGARLEEGGQVLR